MQEIKYVEKILVMRLLGFKQFKREKKYQHIIKCDGNIIYCDFKNKGPRGPQI
jgi:hypothetical protein